MKWYKTDVNVFFTSQKKETKSNIQIYVLEMYAYQWIFLLDNASFIDLSAGEELWCFI